MQSLVYVSRTFPDLVEIEVELKSHIKPLRDLKTFRSYK